MKKSLGATAAVVGAGILLLSAWGAIDINWPWDSAHLASTEKTVVTDGPAKVIGVEPVALDCRARIHAEVPVEGRKEHKVLGQVYRTDKVWMNAIGDIDTCVDSGSVEIVEGEGKATVTIPAESIRFVRPRVDAVATRDSVSYDKGKLGKLTDAFPWVADSEGLTSASYSFAQDVVGGTECMQAAYALTEAAIIDAYQAQLAEQGIPVDRVQVTIEGEPDFAQNGSTDLGDFDFEIDESGITCETTDGAAGADTIAGESDDV